MTTYPASPGETLARTIWAEARSEGQAGMEAVASVVLNRAAHPRWWGKDVRSVCLAPSQFSCWFAEPVGQYHRMMAVTVADPLLKQALAIAATALNGKLVDRTGGADSYANLHICAPAWAVGRKPCAVIGQHSFFRLELSTPVGGKQVITHAPIADLSDAAATEAANDASLAAARAL